MTASLPDWVVPPRPEGWFADDLDRLPDAPRHTELWDGALVFNMSPQRAWHHRVIRTLEFALLEQAEDAARVMAEFSIKLDDRTRPEPDLIVTANPIDDDRTFVHAAEVILAVEVVSPESAQRDRLAKPARYAQAGIESFWLVEEERGHAAVHVYELDPVTHTYLPTGIFRDTLRVTKPFPLEIGLP